MNSKGISVLIYNWNEPLPKQGGMERITDSLARGLKNNGIKTILLCSKVNRLGEKYDAPVPIYYFPTNKKDEFLLDLIEKNSITHIIDQTLGGIIGKFGILKKREQLFKGLALIAVQHNSAKAIIRNFRIAMGRNYNNIFAQFVYDRILLPAKKIHSIYLNKRLFKEQYNNYDKIVLLSESFIDEFIWFYKQADRLKLLAIPNMNSFEYVNSLPKENRVLFVGRLISNTKGCDKLLRIWQQASSRLENWHLDIVGDGPDRKKLQEYAKKLGIRNYTFHGYTDPRPFYEKAKILCMCSIYEGFGLVLTEAMQHSVIPLAFNSFSSVKDIITDSENGFLIPPFKENIYATKLQELMMDVSLQNSLSKNSKISAEKFSPENIIYQWIKLINSTLKH